MGLKLNLGTGHTQIPGFVSVDRVDSADVVLDLGRDPLPFEDDSVDLVFSYHCLEHVDDYLFALGEIHRVLRHGGAFLLGVPYTTLTEFHRVNPYHKHDFSEHSFAFFDSRLKGSAAEDNQIYFKQVFHTLEYRGGFRLLPPPLKRWARRHLLNTVSEVVFGLFAEKPPQTCEVTPADVRRLKVTFQECLDSRVGLEDRQPIGAPARGLLGNFGRPWRGTEYK